MTAGGDSAPQGGRAPSDLVGRWTRRGGRNKTIAAAHEARLSFGQRPAPYAARGVVPMSSVILKDDGECLLYVSNARLSSLVEFALQVAATRPDGPEMSAPLRRFWDQAFPGINFE